ncbi:hypothetical protein DY703_09935 [Salmonella enterica]|nr:ATP-dependent helicase [Salmonella enterica]EBQ9476243.1 hypothetical protein [Salmonella enterica subsp. enterica serovar Kokomlemle]EBJ7122460.1 hypothetical protein [Salmonella enterica]EBU8700472.1 hypothetical protein [Salmonella enterica subsp. enterica serovar Kokomlemle]ECX4750107.1 ATP-dependent helicase [Salmonella enterica]
MSYSDTPEQAAVIAWQGKRLVVGAFAGTGKTTTLRRFAEQNPDERMLYIAYSRAIRDEAEQKFPYHVTCKTSHQLAYAATGRFFALRLVSNLKVTDVARALNSKNWRMARAVLYTLNHFICSADVQITAIHAPDEEELPDSERAQVVTASQRLWLMVTARQGDFPVTHDTYLKLYQLSRPDLSSRYSTLLFDEAQDANPVTSAIVLSQRCRVVLVGDRHQQIYRFRGADNAMDAPQLEHADRLRLTNSFRFGPEVANVANRLLALKGETHKVTGKGPQDRVVVTLYDDFADILDPDMPVDRRNDELNLLYVATTRARRLLVPDPVIREILAQPPAEDILVLPTDGDINGTGDDTDENGEASDVA